MANIAELDMEILEKAADQFREAQRISDAAKTIYNERHSGDMLCICRKRIPIQHMHKCFHCGVWFCPACAKEHFGERSKTPAHRE